nr:RelE/ParE family protein [uncultured bacterium]
MQGTSIMLKPENQVDKKRFKRLKQTEEERGRTEEKAVEVAADQVKEIRKREGRNEHGPRRSEK